MSSPAPPSRLSTALAFVLPGYGERLGRDLWVLFAARIINALAFTGAFPFLAAYLKDDRAMAGVLIGVLYTSQGIIGAACQGLGGVLSERVGQRPVLVWSLVVRAALTLLMGLCISQRAHVGLIALLVIANAMLAGLFQPAADTLVAGLAPEGRRITAFAHQRVAINVGWAIAPAIGGFVSERLSLANAFYAAGPMVLMGALVLSRLPHDTAVTAPSKEPLLARLSAPLADRTVRLQLLGALFTFILAGQMVVTLSLDARGRLNLDKHQLGLVWALNGLLVVFAQMPMAKLVQRLGTRTSLIASSLIYGLSYASIGLVGSFHGLLLAMVFITLGELLNTPAQQAGIAAGATPQTLGRAMGLLGLVMMLGRSLGPLVGGTVHDVWADSPLVMWPLIGALGLAAAAIYAQPEAKRRAGGVDPSGLR